MGRVYKPKYAYTRKDGTRVEKQTEAWYIEYSDANGRWVRRKAGLTKQQAQDALRKAEGDVLSEKNGLPTRRAQDLPCLELAQSYVTALRPRASASYPGKLDGRLQALFRGCRAIRLKDLTPDAVEAFLVGLGESGRSARTINTYLQAAKGMLNWAVRNRKIPYNPLDCLLPRPERCDRRRVRRALTEEELVRFFGAATDGPFRRMARAYRGGKLGPEVIAALQEQAGKNVLIYRLLLETGLRANEVRSLTWADIDLAAGTFTTRSHWTGNKNGNEETLPLAPGLKQALAAWRAAHPGPETSRVVDMPRNFVRIFYDDIKAVDIPQRDAADRVLDLHALRHTFGTRLVAAGIDIKTVQTLMRHSTPVLTLAIYVHSDRGRLAQALATVPVVVPSPAATPAPFTQRFTIAGPVGERPEAVAVAG